MHVMACNRLWRYWVSEAIMDAECKIMTGEQGKVPSVVGQATAFLGRERRVFM